MVEHSGQSRRQADGDNSFALLLIDVINDFDFPEADQLLSFALRMAEPLARLRQRAILSCIPVIYVNDNFGRWRTTLHSQVSHCLSAANPGIRIVELLQPGDDDYFILKPRHSGFHNTPLDTLLRHLDVDTLVLTGVATDICVYFTANDAYMRDYSLYVPRDCVAANSGKINTFSLTQLARIMKADTRPSTRLRFPGEQADHDSAES